MRPFTTEIFIQRARAIHGGKYDYSKVVYTRSSKKVEIICPEHDSFFQTANSHLMGSGCPKCKAIACSKRMSEECLKKNGGSLLTFYPDIAKEWDYSKNNFAPSEVSSQSCKKVWWICSVCGHNWQTRVQSRTKFGVGCPVCGKAKNIESRKKRCLEQMGALSQTHPYLLEEWDYDKNIDVSPNDITASYSKKVHWCCKRGHHWQAPVNRRVRLGVGCSRCANEYGTSFSEQAIAFYLGKLTAVKNRYQYQGVEIDIYIPVSRVAIEYDGLFYHSGDKSKKKEQKKDAFLQSQNIRIIRIKEADTNKVENNTIYVKATSTHSHLIWAISELCKLLRLPIPDVNVDRDRTAIYEQYLSIEKENSLAVQYPELAAQWDYKKNGKVDPSYVRSLSNFKFWWRCEKEHSWQATVASRVQGNGCPCCSFKTLVVGENDLLSQNPELAKEWHHEKNGTLLPDQITVNNGNKVWWRCAECGHEWRASVAHRNDNRGCPVCGRKKCDKSRSLTFVRKNGSIAELYPHLVREWDYEKNGDLRPETTSAHNGNKVWWICPECGNNWQAYVSNRADKGCGCPQCAKILNAENKREIARQQALAGNNIVEKFPQLLEDWDYAKNININPREIQPGSSIHVHWKCHTCGHEWNIAVSHRVRGTRCPMCARYHKK